MEAQELGLCQHLNRLDEIGIPPCYNLIGQYANSILACSHNELESPPPRVSEKWTQRFLAHHSEYKIRKQKTFDIERKRAHHSEDLRDWFSQFDKLKKEKGVLDGDSYNFDETGFRIGIGKDK